MCVNQYLSDFLSFFFKIKLNYKIKIVYVLKPRLNNEHFQTYKLRNNTDLEDYVIRKNVL